MPRAERMPPCMVPTCKKLPRDFPDLKYYVLPRQGELRDAWLKAVKVDGSGFSANSKHYRVCKEHFSPESFERNLADELLGLNKPKKLKPAAVPDLLLPPEEEVKLEEDNEQAEDLTEAEEESSEAKAERKITTRAKSRGKRNTARRTRKKIPVPELPKPKHGCLICSKAPSKVKSYSDKYNLPGSSNSELLNKQLWHMFVLQNIFQLPSSKFQHLFQKFGDNLQPEKWFHLCSKCVADIAQAISLHLEIVKLQTKLKAKVEKVRKLAKETVELDKDTELEKNEVETVLWSMIRELNGILLPTDPTNANASIKIEPTEDDPMEFAGCSNTSPGNNDLDLNVFNVAARIDKLLQQNAEIVGEPLLRPAGVVSDSDSDDDSSGKVKRRKVNKIPIVKGSRIDPASITKKVSPPIPVQKVAKPNIPKEPNIPIPKDPNIPKEPKPEQFKCELCPAIFCTEKLFDDHTEAHKTSKENGDKFSCKFCGWAILNESLMRQHVEVRHNDMSIPSDPVSDPQPKKRSRKQQLNLRRFGEDGSSNKTKDSEQTETNIPIPAKNEASPIDIPKPLFYRSDLNSKHFLFPQKCPFCIVQFMNLESMEKHLALHERNADLHPELVCPHPPCFLPFENKHRLQLHLKFRHPQKKIAATVCTARANKISQFHVQQRQSRLRKQKMAEVRATETGELGCNMCEENFSTKSCLTRHKRKYHADELGIDHFLCSHCPKTFVCEIGLQNHIEMFHSEIIAQCDLCGQGFPSKRLLERHHQQIHEQKKYICDRCGNEFNSFENLRSHKRKFYGENVSLNPTKSQQILRSRKPRRCRYCNVVSPHYAAWKRHVRTHATSECNICGKFFVSGDCVNKHKVLVHEKGSSTLVNCLYCQKEFSSKPAVIRHLRFCKPYQKLNLSASGEFECSGCQKTFISKPALWGHISGCPNRLQDEEDAENAEIPNNDKTEDANNSQSTSNAAATIDVS